MGAKSKDNEIKMKDIGVSGNTEPRYPDSVHIFSRGVRAIFILDVGRICNL